MSEVAVTILSSGLGAALVTGIFGVIMWRLNRSAARADSAAAKKTRTEEQIGNVVVGLRAIMYKEIKMLGREYLHTGTISTEDLEDLLTMHRIYHDELGGNGFLDSLIEQVKRIPLEDCTCSREENER